MWCALWDGSGVCVFVWWWVWVWVWVWMGYLMTSAPDLKATVAHVPLPLLFSSVCVCVGVWACVSVCTCVCAWVCGCV
jgi:hypothetical protein